MKDYVLQSQTDLVAISCPFIRESQIVRRWMETHGQLNVHHAMVVLMSCGWVKAYIVSANNSAAY